MRKNSKSFDCVEMKRAGALRIYEETKDFTLEEELAYWNERSKEMLRAIETAPEIEQSSLTATPKPSGKS